MRKKVILSPGIIVLLLSFLFSAGNIAHAEIKTIFAEGIARVGETETEVQAKQRAWLDAQRQALEEAGVVIAGSTTVTNHELVDDWIQSVTMAKVETKLLSETRSFENNLVVYRVKLACRINTDDIASLNAELENIAIGKHRPYEPGKPPATRSSAPVAERVKDFALKNGSLYTGTLADGLPDGQGVMLYPDGGKYEGAFRKGLRQGEGVMTWANGDCYRGHWLKDMRTGRGEFVSAQGNRQTGRWLNDLFYEE
ncbi:hypothetical protein [Sporomusa acidovorans]|uniref:MORN repeat protein n=1 Tax=Sporomusa acidovorans (strain ATCC 49682 / DSM 3132 / Mol) TaxID=1123286 RepID=A0ABZ3JBI9_SPOA4|nr:hypothetical protein [Sporomusa acidovorans]OZC13316.1 MORN repeat protein [Sporomusa acidovorans DSM 3132]SDD96866.1 MORN repeat-containing protein [Sporomusa acidovorans]